MTAGSQGRMRDSVEAVAGAVLEKYSNVSCPIVSHVSNLSLIDGVDKRPVCVCRALTLCGDRIALCTMLCDALRCHTMPCDAAQYMALYSARCFVMPCNAQAAIGACK